MSNPKNPTILEFIDAFAPDMNDTTVRVKDATGQQFSFYILAFDQNGDIAVTSNADPDALRRYLGESLEKLDNPAYRNEAKLMTMQPLTNSVH